MSPAFRRGDVELYYEVHGAGLPLVLICGMATHLGYFSSLVRSLARERRVILFDNRGSGRSSCPPGPYSVPQMADDLEGLLDHLHIDRADLLGHSMGGDIALHLAATRPGRVRRLVLYSTVAVMSWPGQRFLESVLALWRRHGDLDGGTLARLFIPWSYGSAVIADAESVEGLVELAEKSPYKLSLEGYEAQLSACRAFDGRDLLPRVQAPTLVLGGLEDLLATPTHQHFLQSALADARLALAAAGHNAHLEARAWFLEQVSAFLRDALTAPGSP